MSIFPDLFVDPALRTRQDQLNGTWNALQASWTTCNNTPDSLFPEFSTDYAAWQAFYASESDWSSDSFNATNEWQTKAASWSTQLSSWGCTGNFDVTSTDPAPSSGIPGVKAAPADATSAFSQVTAAISSAGSGLWTSLSTIGWVAIGIVVLVIVGMVYLVPRTKISAPSGSIG